MTDTEIAIAALTDWPEGARPQKVYIDERGLPRTQSPTGRPHMLRWDHAIALFVAAGLEWLLEKERMQTIARGDNTYIAFRMPGEIVDRGLQPTLLSAPDAAIRATKGGGDE